MRLLGTKDLDIWHALDSVPQTLDYNGRVSLQTAAAASAAGAGAAAAAATSAASSASSAAAAATSGNKGEFMIQLIM